jgi:hypothetical protein
MDNLSNRQNRNWLWLVTAVVLAGAGFAILNNQHQQRLQAEAQARASQAQAQAARAAQDQANRDAMQRMEGELALKNELDAASQREAALQAERGFQDLRTQRAKLEKQVDCERIQLTVSQLTTKGDTDQATKLKTLWAVPCPNLQAAR